MSRRSGLRDPLSPSRAMQRTIYIVLAIAGACSTSCRFCLAVGHRLQEPAGLRRKRLVVAVRPRPWLAHPRRAARPRQRPHHRSGAGLFNSVLVTIVRRVGRVMLAALAGYSLARIRFPGYRLVFGADPRRDDGPTDHSGDPPLPRAQGARTAQHLPRTDRATHVRCLRDLLDEAVHGADPGGDRRGGRDRRRRPGGDVHPGVSCPSPARPSSR